jgi:predicted acylesterase/phospholipase RssA
MSTYEVVVPDTMGGEIVVHRTEDKAEALRVKASYAKDAAFPRVAVREQEPSV